MSKVLGWRIRSYDRMQAVDLIALRGSDDEDEDEDEDDERDEEDQDREDEDDGYSE